jgi:hypothetical protein
MGLKPPIRYGNKSIEESTKISNSHKRLVLLGIHHLWRGGKTKEKYPDKWIGTLRRSIRERDHYICAICEIKQKKKLFPVHHIDYNKDNCDPNNLITLCAGCHSKTNFNREKWTIVLSNIINKKTNE